MKRGLWVLLFSGLTACDTLVSSERERELWDALEIRDYQFTYNVACFCGFVGPNPAIITVRDGVVTRVEYPIGSAQGSGSYPVQGYPTVDSLFARIERVQEKNPAELDVDFDETYHYPRSIDIDYIKNAIDDEISYGVTGFKVLSPNQ